MTKRLSGTAEKINPRDLIVLGELSASNGDYFEYLRVISERIEMPQNEVRIRARRLTRNGYAKLIQLFDEETGLACGSTYVRTAKFDA